MTGRSERHSIGAAAKIVGLSIETIRAWERRYGLVSPARDRAGVRLYAAQDIERLTLARAAIEQGHPIKRIASLSNEQLCALSGRAPTGEAGTNSNRVVADVIEAISRYDVYDAETFLHAAMQMFSRDDFFIDVLSPLMSRVGTMWESGRFSVAQEHLVSCLVRNVVGNITRLGRLRHVNRMIFATPPNELHEFGIVFAASLASGHKVRTYVLGPNVPVMDVVSAARAIQAKVIAIGCTLEAGDVALTRYLATLEMHLPAGTTVWVGGRGLKHSDTYGWPARMHLVATLREFVQRCASLR